MGADANSQSVFTNPIVRNIITVDNIFSEFSVYCNIKNRISPNGLIVYVNISSQYKTVLYISNYNETFEISEIRRPILM